MPRLIPFCVLIAIVILLSKEISILSQIYCIALHTQRPRKCYNEVCILVSVAIKIVIVNSYLRLILLRTFLYFSSRVLLEMFQVSLPERETINFAQALKMKCLC